MKRALFGAMLAAACGEGGSIAKGSLQVFVVPEDSITAGLEPGTGLENVIDGWKVEYTRFLVTVGNFRASSTTGARLADPTTYVLDLRNPPPGGYVTFESKQVDAVTYDRVGQDMPVPSATTRALPPTRAEDAAFMIAHGYSLYFEATLTKPDGRSCKPPSHAPEDCVAAPRIKVAWGFAMGTAFDDCAKGTKAGFSVPAGGSVGVKPTLHGDHWFFDNVTEGAEVAKRRAQYVADADLDHDGETTMSELRAIPSADLFSTDTYKLSGAIGGKPILTGWDYVEAQARTIHDYMGDGECPTRTVLK